MESTTILQIISGFKPTVDGMGDFSRLLGAALWRTYAIRSHFLARRRPSKPFNSEEIAPNTISYSTEMATYTEELLALVRQQHFRFAVLHYGPYAYSITGNPAAFCSVIEELAKHLDILIFFHETYAGGPFWRRAFWTKREQRQSIGRLHRIGKVSFTSTKKYADQLIGSAGIGREPIRIPIFSNMGEPEHPLPIAERKRQMIVFGQLATRLRLYKERQMFEELCQWLRIGSIVDIGSGNHRLIPDSIAGAPIRRMGRLEDTQISELLSESIAGVIVYPPDLWGKSSVIGAYAAHSVLPVLVPEKQTPAPDLVVPYIEVKELRELRGTDGMISDAAIQQLVDRCHRAYTAHQSVDRCAEVMASYILG